MLYLNKILANYLWKMASEDNSLKLSNFSPKLVAPLKRDNKPRISEQEARFLMCLILNNLNVFYSIETPTKETYKFKGKSKRSASTDLTLFELKGDKLYRIFNIEFKAHNPKEKDLSKDIEKLVKENINGGWFHLFKNVDSKTLVTIFEKMKEAFNHNRIFESLKKEIIFAFCVLEKRWLCQKILKPRMDIESFFFLDYKVRKNNIIINDINGWEIFQI